MPKHFNLACFGKLFIDFLEGGGGETSVCCFTFIYLNFKYFIVILFQLYQFSPLVCLCPAHSLLPESFPTLLIIPTGHSYTVLD